ncbi:unnamed protein product [Peniophora sp. CBMAI 1063]|nr:unnamed protein product [Peniophora sp. CBMAI 1063]
MSSGAPALSLATHLSHTYLSQSDSSDDPAYNPFADTTPSTSTSQARSKSGTTGYAGPYSASTPSTSVLRPRRRGSDSVLGRAGGSPGVHARAPTLDISAPSPSPSRPVQSLQRRRSDYTQTNGSAGGAVEEEEEGEGEGEEDEDHPLRRRSSSRSVRSTASTKPRLRAALAATRESREEGREARGREARREGQRAVLVHQVTPTDSLPGVSLKYGIALSDLRRANQLWAHDSIHLRATLLVPLDQARNARIAVVDAAAEGKDLLSPDDGDRFTRSPDGRGVGGSGLLSPESSDEPTSYTASPPRLSQDPSSSSSSRPSRSPNRTRTRTSHARSATEPPSAPAPHLTVTRVPASRLSFFPPPAQHKAKERVRASEELPRLGGLSGADVGRARAGSDLPHRHRRPSPRARSRDLFSLLTPPASSSSPSSSQHDYFSSTTHPNQAPGQDALAAAKSLGRAAGRAAGWLADALAIPVPVPPLPLQNALGKGVGERGDAVELGSARKGKGRAAPGSGSGSATPRNHNNSGNSGKYNPWFTPRAPSPALSDGVSTASSASLSPFVPPRAKNRRGVDESGVDGEGIRMASSPPRVQAQPEARRGMVVPTSRR